MVSILVADDDKIIRKGLMKIIESNMQEFKIIGEAANGSVALEKIKELKPDILITDIKMPIMDGIELVSNIKDLSLGTRSIVLSGFDEYKFIRETFKNGAVDYILKPIDNKALFELLIKIKTDMDKERYEKEEYQRKIEESTMFLREEFLSEILEGDYIDEEYLDEKVAKFNILTKGRFYIALIDIDDFFKKYDIESNEIVYISNAKAIVYKLLRGLEKFKIIVCKKDDKIAILFSSDNDNIYSILNDVRDKAGEKINNTLSIGISKNFDNLREIREGYGQAILALKNRFYFGKNHTYVYDNDKVFSYTIDYKTVEALITSIINEIELCNSFKIKFSVEKLFNYIIEKKLEPDRFRKLLLNVMLRINSSITDLQYITYTESRNNDISYYIKEINTCDELKEYFLNSLQCAVDKVVKFRKERGKKIIEKAKGYINDNYRKEMTLKDVANYVYLNSNYFSELFKNEVGENFIEYLIETRIKAAKELLKQNNFKIYEVAEKVGYKEPVSFSRAFKKVVGVSPKEYVQLL